jgi:hypothetical protein
MADAAVARATRGVREDVRDDVDAPGDATP